ncbi:MAG: DUF4139 domain-containing protein [Candidatus Diapherotrites archaeon]
MTEKNKVLILAFLVFIFASLLLILSLLLRAPEKSESFMDYGKESSFGAETSNKADKTNIKSYASVVSSEKPQNIMIKFAESTSEYKEGTELTVYNIDMALVKELRRLDLKSGLNLVKYEDVASKIKPDSVLFVDLTDPKAIVIEQNYEYDTENLDKILENYLGKIITVYSKDGNSFTGKLLSYKGNILLEVDNRVIAISDAVRYEFLSGLENLVMKPTLVWKLYTEKEGQHNTQTSYITTGISWFGSYIAKISADEKYMDLTGWVTINNNSGTSYPNTSLKLVAGEVNVSSDYKYYVYKEAYSDISATPVPAGSQFTEQSLFEYHVYNLERKTDIKDKETKQINFLEANSIPLKKKYVFEDSTSYYYSYGEKENKGKVKVIVSFDNSQSSNLGTPLPKGNVRVYKEDSQNKLQFIGEDSIYHTPKDGNVSLFLGYAFDITAEKKIVESLRLGENCTKNSYEINFRNHKLEDITIIATQKSSYKNNELVNSSHKSRKVDAYTFEFDVPVKAGSETKLTYTITSCW